MDSLKILEGYWFYMKLMCMLCPSLHPLLWYPLLTPFAVPIAGCRACRWALSPTEQIELRRFVAMIDKAHEEMFSFISFYRFAEMFCPDEFSAKALPGTGAHWHVDHARPWRSRRVPEDATRYAAILRCAALTSHAWVEPGFMTSRANQYLKKVGGAFFDPGRRDGEVRLSPLTSTIPVTSASHSFVRASL